MRIADRGMLIRDVALLLAGVCLLLLACDANLTPAGDIEDPEPVFECIPDLDAQIDADELPLELELAVSYTVSGPGAAVDLAGEVDSAGRRAWDFSSVSEDDERIEIAAQSLGSKWYGPAMVGATFVVPAADPGGLDGAYIRDERGLSIVGLASPDENPPGGQTLLVYDAPVLVLRFPVISGDAFVSAGDITGGTLDGLPYNGTDTYEVSVDGVGRAALPDVTFTQAMRVRTRVEVAPAAGGITSTRRQVSFFFECFGEVVRATSNNGEPNADFTSAAELRRFAL